MRETTASARAGHSGVALRLANMARRGLLALASSVSRWQLSGQDGEAAFEDVPVYQQAGFASWPAAGEAVTAILLALGGSARNLAVIASSSTLGRPAMSAGETALWNSLGKGVKATAAGEVRLGAAALALEQVVKGTTYRAAEASMHASIAAAAATVATALGALAIIPTPTPADFKTAFAAVATFLSELAAAQAAFEASSATYLSTVTKTE